MSKADSIIFRVPVGAGCLIRCVVNCQLREAGLGQAGKLRLYSREGMLMLTLRVVLGTESILTVRKTRVATVRRN
eukprot:3935249-Rhodomonas_salina.3